RYHSGMDIGGDYGDPIIAAAAGIVTYSGWISGYGYAVIIDHGGGISTLYGHNEALAVAEGQTVSQGQVIAYCGSTGNSTGPHCHFEVREGGEPVDPMGYL
nr:M23 family metallopeptidase [Schwartzia sp. (in: firmicutes)]